MFRRLLQSIRFRLFLVSFGVCVSIVAALLIYLPSVYIASLNHSLEAKATTYGKLLSTESESAIAFDDRETARQTFAAASQDADVRSLALYKENGSLLHAFGDPLEDAPANGDAVLDLSVTRVFQGVRATTPVVSKEGVRGFLVVELSTETVEAEKRRVEKIAILCFAVALTAAFLGAWSVGRSLAKRLGALVGATARVAGGDLSPAPIADHRADEVGELVGAFNSMQTKLRELVDQMRRSADEEQARLDGLVRARTAELGARNADMQLVLDHVDQGLFTIDRYGQIVGERSRAGERAFGVPQENATLWSLLGEGNPALTSSLELGWGQVVEDMLPLELSLAQLPTALTRDGRSYIIGYTPVLEAEVLRGALVIVSDSTSEVERARAEELQAESIRLFECIAADRGGFLDFFAEASGMVNAVATAPDVTPALKRTLHTLKGNAAIMGITSVATSCHLLEDDLEEHGRLSSANLVRLDEAWRAVATRTRSFAGEDNHGVTVRKADLEVLATDVVNQLPRSALLERIRRLGLQPLAPHLDRLADQAKRLGKRLEKSVNVKVEATDVRLFDGAWSPWFGSLVHVVRNAIDHGLERAEERVSAGKSAEGEMVVRAFETLTEVVVEVADDGRGIDWARVAEKARTHGLPCGTQYDLTEVLFHDGLSTRDEVTELSGRGVGLGAVRSACRALGGHVRIYSTAQQGTTISFRFPKPRATDPILRRAIESILPAE